MIKHFYSARQPLIRQCDQKVYSRRRNLTGAYNEVTCLKCLYIELEKIQTNISRNNIQTRINQLEYKQDFAALLEE